MILVKPSATLLSITPDAVGLIEEAARTCYQSDPRGELGYMVRKILVDGHLTPIRHASATIRFVGDRGFTHELVRHQVGTVFCQESTRYCNYGNDRFGGEIRLIDDSDSDLGLPIRQDIANAIEVAYMKLLRLGERAQKARDFLPNILKSQIDCTMTFEAWLHFFDLRWYGLTGVPHPRMSRMAGMALEILRHEVPEVFGVEAFRIRWTGQRDRLDRAITHLE